MITVLTPTYNRAHVLRRLHASLVAQACEDFEWLVIDDGSSDDTAGLIAELSRSSRFPVRYFFQPNGGKHSAINAGVRMAHGGWILILDSDDALITDALGVVHQAVDQYGGSEKVSGFCFRKCHFDGRLIGKPSVLPGPVNLHPTIAGTMFKGDLAYVFRRTAMLREPFPVFQGEKFVPELLVWNRIGDAGEILAFPNRPIYCCEYLEDGYSANFKRNLRRNPKGFLLYYRTQFFRERSFTRQLKCAVRSLQCTWYALLNGLRA